jgi:hypothetical protein
MAIYSLAVRTSITTTNALSTLVTAATTRANLLEVGTTLTTAGTTNWIGLGHMTAGTTIGGTANGQAEDMASPQTSPTVVGTTWTTQPTTPAQFFRRATFPATIGAGIIWTFPRGILVPVSNNVGLWNANTASGTMDQWYCWDE